MDKNKIKEVLVCEESRCDSEDTSCSMSCELVETIEQNEKSGSGN